MRKWFKKIFGRKDTSSKQLLNKLREEERAEQYELKKMSPERLAKEFSEVLEEYKTDINARWTFHPAEYGDATSIGGTRDYLHLLINRSRELGLVLDIKKLVALDKAWQDWCLQRIKVDFVEKPRYQLSSRQEPKENWWWWIDRLDELTEQERSTI
jgi:hypothetical protein